MTDDSLAPVVPINGQGPTTTDSDESQRILATVAPIEPRPARPTIPLAEAQLCVDCDTIYQRDAGEGCPKCNSRVAFAIARVIAPRGTKTPWRRAAR